jgi:rhamnose utilization protein RhaD (predicted bifunctional aldolase and dehydrogenase)
MTASAPRDGEYRALLELSAALGADPLRTQAAGGNTSIKRDGVMWIKASGKWLAHAMREAVMTPVLIEPLRQAIANGDPRAERAVDFIDSTRNSLGLRPSIETSVHAVIPSPIVVHIHCVNTIAPAVRRDG